MAVVEHGSAEEHDLNWLSSPYWPRLSNDGSEVVFTDQSEHAGHNYSVYIRKTDGYPAVRIGEGGFAINLSADGKWALLVLPGDPRLQVVPVGAGQTRVLQWDGIFPRWGCLFPDGQHILFENSPSAANPGVYVADMSGAPPKLLSTEVRDVGLVSPDGKSFFGQRKEQAVVHSIADNSDTPIRGLNPNEEPIAWAADSKHVFTQSSSATGVVLTRLDLESGRREPWQVIKPKDQIGLRPMATPVGITTDGRWIAFTYGTQNGQLYATDGLK